MAGMARGESTLTRDACLCDPSRSWRPQSRRVDVAMRQHPSSIKVRSVRDTEHSGKYGYGALA